ncbi:hypothetical protein [Polymorphospora rubra]|uniref:Uncharacterized protein n=1 Tax=Polymorphospora rubra TaxID=338584 RepID=A0A810N556_9ACTN|nr:hypothetical protein [Polymorphospora rubra]BCJ68642.1 hypothetical protein Prubr_56630 [Polymorphospora rubra]
MLGERIAEAVQRHVARPGEQVVGHVVHPDTIAVKTTGDTYFADPADWSIAGHPGVEAAYRVVVDGMMDNFVITYGLLAPAGGGEVLLLNELAVLRDLPRRLGAPVEPLAYAELLAELCSGPALDQPVVRPMAATTRHRAGWLIRDVAQLRERYPEVDPDLVAPPVVRADPPAAEFYSHNYVLHHAVSGLGIYRWTVELPPDGPARWERQVVVAELPVRPWLHQGPGADPTG